MNIELVSSVKPKIRSKNYINEFESPLQEPIDCQNVERKIVVTEVNYPLTTKNVLKDTCWFQLHIVLKNVKKIEPTAIEGIKYIFTRLPNITTSQRQKFIPKPGIINIKADKIILPTGSYDVDVILNTINQNLNQYGCNATLNENRKVMVVFKDSYEYWVHLDQGFPKKSVATAPSNKTYQNVWYTRSSNKKRDETGEDGGVIQEFRYSNTITDVEYRLTLSPHLAFILGFEKDNYVVGAGESLKADYLPDVYGGIDRIFIYCEEVENEILGGGKSNLLVSVPLQIQGQTQGGAASFSPAVAERKIKRMILQSLNISAKNLIGDLIPFDSGTLSIKAIIQ